MAMMRTRAFNIAAVERETGLSKMVLRMWERRYGFPAPERDANGDRIYSLEVVERLGLIKRLMDQGHRPGKLIGTAREKLAALVPRPAKPRTKKAKIESQELTDLIALIRKHDATGYQQALQQRFSREGLQRFVQETVVPLARLVGESWERGEFEIFEEHIFSELTMRQLRQAIAGLPAGKRGPRVLLTTVPNEPHVLGLLMVEALLALEGAECIPFGLQMPLLEISRAASAHRADVVALSFSAAFPLRHIPELLTQLRTLLPSDMALWAGGAGVSRLKPIAGVLLMVTLDDALKALAGLRSQGSPSLA
jgi:DNA-binding transcriptional MerR regulator/methylmalonyl-CoA mutase cobalamin-binding subunit